MLKHIRISAVLNHVYSFHFRSGKLYLLVLSSGRTMKEGEEGTKGWYLETDGFISVGKTVFDKLWIKQKDLDSKGYTSDQNSGQGKVRDGIDHVLFLTWGI